MSRRLHRSPQTRTTASQVTPLPEGVAVSVAGFDGTVIATICRRLEPANGETQMSVVSVDGDIDLDSAPLLRQALMVAIDARPRTCLDVRRVEFFSAAGVQVLLAAQQHATHLGHSFAVHGVHGITERVLTIVGLDHAFPTIG